MTILIAAALDTKGEECFFIKEMVEKRRLNGLVIDCGSLGRPFKKGDITRHEVARKGGTPLGVLLKTGNKGKVIQGMTDGLKAWVKELYEKEEIHGIFAPGEDRMRIPSQMEMPYLVAPGAIDYITMGPYRELSRTWQKRNLIIHNRNITLVRAMEKEMILAARFLSRKLNKTKGPVRVMIPLKGFCEPNAKGKPFYDPQADGRFIRTLEENLRSDILIIKVNDHINDVSFVRKGAEQMLQMLS
jgi:uncharacterized protein (UPF0261 family)